jgi:hypothetical protein
VIAGFLALARPESTVRILGGVVEDNLSEKGEEGKIPKPLENCRSQAQPRALAGFVRRDRGFCVDLWTRPSGRKGRLEGCAVQQAYISNRANQPDLSLDTASRQERADRTDSQLHADEPSQFAIPSPFRASSTAPIPSSSVPRV